MAELIIRNEVPNKVTVSWAMRASEIVIIAILYFITAKFGQLLAIDPGNVTPIWIPSGIMLAAVLWRGYRIWPGIFIGAFFGNTWAYFIGSASDVLIPTVIAGLSNGAGDVLCFVVGAYLIKRSTGSSFPFEKVRDVVMFVFFGALLGAAISAFFGATSLCLVSILPWDLYPEVLMTWFIGDAVGVLLITPFLLFWLTKTNRVVFAYEEFIFLLVLFVACIFCLDLITIEKDFSLPNNILIFVLIWSVFRLSPQITFSAILLIGAVSIATIAMGAGYYSDKNINYALIELQLFLSTLAIASMVIHASLHARNNAEAKLLEANRLLENRVKQRTQELEALSATDPLTGIHNRRSIFELLEIELKRSSRHRASFSLLMLDIDLFKSINDRFGHHVGDIVLQNVCQECIEELREIDSMGRIGGEEFIILLPETNVEGAEKIAERIRKRIEENEIIIESEKIKVTVSIGVTKNQIDESKESLLKRSDQAMYLSKEKGRNQINSI